MSNIFFFAIRHLILFYYNYLATHLNWNIKMFLNHYCTYTYQLSYIVWFIYYIRMYFNSYFRKIELNTTSTYLLAMTRVCATADIKEEMSTSWLSCKFPIASSRVLTTMFHMPIWINKQFILMVTSEALIHAACFVLFMSIKGYVNIWLLPQQIILKYQQHYNTVYLLYIIQGHSS